MLSAGDAVSLLEPLRSLHATCFACLVQLVATLQMNIKVSTSDGLQHVDNQLIISTLQPSVNASGTVVVFKGYAWERHLTQVGYHAQVAPLCRGETKIEQVKLRCSCRSGQWGVTASL